MSSNAGNAQQPTDVGQQHPDEHYYASGSFTSQALYPTTGAFTHLPLRKTVSGHPAREHPNANNIFLRDLLGHCYTLPMVTLNFTIVEIIVLLPNWFKNKAVGARFVNNEITAAIHFMILEEHRDLKFADAKQEDKARKTVADEYRKVMRKTVPGWTKAKHTATSGWDYNLMAMGGFVPDDVRMHNYRRPASIPFRDLTIGVKKLPEGTHAGDLTRALNYALEHPTHTFMFPEDLPTILDHIGRTPITMAHTDRLIVRRYAGIKQKQDHEKKYPPRFYTPRPDVSELIARTRPSHGSPYKHQMVQAAMHSPPQDGQPAATVPVESPGKSSRDHQSGPGMATMRSLQGRTAPTQNDGAEHQEPAIHMQAQPAPVSGIDKLPRLLPNMTADIIRPQGIKRPHNDYEDGSSEAMDALLQPHLRQKESLMLMPPSSSRYAPRHLLRDCVEGNVGFDGSPLAEAARYSQRPDQTDTDWYVENVPWLAQLLSAAQPDGGGL